MPGPNFVRLSDVVNDKHDDFDHILERIQNTLSLSDYDVDVIRRVNSILKEPTPSVQLQIQSRVSALDSLRVELLDLIYDVNVQNNDLEYRYKETYDREFAMLVKADRPSQQAIDSEIHAKSRAMQDMRQNLNNFDALKGLLFGYLKSLDKSRETCMSLWGTY